MQRLRKILIATDAWRPQVNGVVRTLESVTKAARDLGTEITLLTPDPFPSFALPTYGSIRCAITGPRAIARRIETAAPDAIHIATEGPVGHAVRRYCLRRGLSFTTSYMTKFPEYIAERFPVPEAWSYALLRRFHAAAAVTMVSTPTLHRELEQHGFTHLARWTRGVDTALFRPERAITLDLPRPIFVTAGRVAIEKNLPAFLSLDLPGSKLVIGDGPQLPELRRRFPDAHFLGPLEGETLAGHIAAADVFVFPSRTDTFGLVQLEALACGLPVAAFPVPGPQDVIGGTSVGVLHDDLGQACHAALGIPRTDCRAFALDFSWEKSALQFIGNCRPYHAPARYPAATGDQLMVSRPAA